MGGGPRRPLGLRRDAVELSGDLDGDGTAFLRIAVRGDDPALVGRAFSSSVVETTLASYPGTFFTAAPGGPSEVARYWPTSVDATLVPALVDLDGTRCRDRTSMARAHHRPRRSRPPGRGRGGGAAPAETVRVPLGVLVGGRSGDKGGNANLGLWAESDEAGQWLRHALSVERLRTLLPEVGGLEIDRYELANLRAVNFVVHGLLGWGVASNLRLDGQAKGLAELVRSRPVEVPASLVASGPPARRLAAWPAPDAGKVH